MNALFDSVPSPDLENQCPPPKINFFDFEEVLIAAGLHVSAKALNTKTMSTPRERDAEDIFNLRIHKSRRRKFDTRLRTECDQGGRTV